MRSGALKRRMGITARVAPRPEERSRLKFRDDVRLDTSQVEDRRKQLMSLAEGRAGHVGDTSSPVGAVSKAALKRRLKGR